MATRRSGYSLVLQTASTCVTKLVKLFSDSRWISRTCVTEYPLNYKSHAVRVIVALSDHIPADKTVPTLFKWRTPTPHPHAHLHDYELIPLIGDSAVFTLLLVSLQESCAGVTPAFVRTYYALGALKKKVKSPGISMDTH